MRLKSCIMKNRITFLVFLALTTIKYYASERLLREVWISKKETRCLCLPWKTCLRWAALKLVLAQRMIANFWYEISHAMVDWYWNYSSILCLILGAPNWKDTIESFEPSENCRDRATDRSMDLKIFIRNFHCWQVTFSF